MRFFSFFTVLLLCNVVFAQPKIEDIRYGDMDNWIDRQIEESGIIGGATKHVWAIGPTMTIEGDEAYVNKGGLSVGFIKCNGQGRRHYQDQYVGIP